MIEVKLTELILLFLNFIPDVGTAFLHTDNDGETLMKLRGVCVC